MPLANANSVSQDLPLEREQRLPLEEEKALRSAIKPRTWTLPRYVRKTSRRQDSGLFQSEVQNPKLVD
ncbi:MAG: hypothetical protein V7K48_05180 [Nostoc sp.]|uniref:hypothetical protein n=1 Tax=Nostoc sp. TaxID=1180 RepID=UPI002FF62423